MLVGKLSLVWISLFLTEWSILSFKKFLNYKSSIAINGVSLTIAKVLTNVFLIVVIPHTLKLTNLKNIKKNDIVNVEIDIIAKYIKNLNK